MHRITLGAIAVMLVAACSNSGPSSGPEGRVCTMEAKICPDGSSVGRVRPSCEFAPCPLPR